MLDASPDLQPPPPQLVVAWRRHFPSLVMRVLLVLLVFLTPGGARASCDAWSGNGPEGGSVWLLAVAPSDAAVVYAATRGGGVFKSLDSGGSWAAASAGLGDPDVRALVVDPTDPAGVFAATPSGIFETNDGGASWKPTGYTQQADSLAIDPANPAVLYAGALADLVALHKSTDGGASWAALDLQSQAWDIAIDPSDSQTVYVATSISGTQKTTDGGANWFAVAAQVHREVAPVPSQPQVLYGAHHLAGVTKSTDGGATWSDIGNGLPGLGARSIAAATADLAFVGTDSGVYRTTNGGASWSPVINGLSQTRVHVIALDHSDPMTVYAGTSGGGIFQTIDGGALWSEANEGLTAVAIRSIATRSDTPNTYYAAGEGGVYRTLDQGTTWARMFTPSANDTGVAVLWDPSLPSTLYAGFSSSGVWRSLDGGDSWTDITGAELPPFVSDLKIDPQDANTLYAASNGQIHESNDSGATWNQLATVQGGKIAIDPSDSQILYVAANTRVWASADGGDSWSPENLPARVESVAVHPRSRTAYAGTRSGLYASTDGGASWSAAGLVNLIVFGIAVSPGLPSTLAAGTNQGLWMSEDEGASWFPIALGLENFETFAVSIAPQNARWIRAGFRTHSVRSVLPDDTFETLGSAGSDDVCWGASIAYGVKQHRQQCDQDWLRFAGVAGSVIRIQTTQLSGLSDTTLAVELSCSGAVLAFSDDAAPGDPASLIDFTLPQDGVYDVLVSQAGGQYDLGDRYVIEVEDVTPGHALFADSFESGDVSQWNSGAP